MIEFLDFNMFVNMKLLMEVALLILRLKLGQTINKLISYISAKTTFKTLNIGVIATAGHSVLSIQFFFPALRISVCS